MPNLKNKKVIKDQQGQRKYPGRVTEIQGDTMATTGYGDIPLYVVPNVGNPMVVLANSGNRVFPGASSFTEYPIAKNGGWLEKYGDGGDFNDYKRPGPVEDGSTGMTGMMKSKIATEAHYGNPSALRMVSPNPNKYTWTGEELDFNGNQASPAGYTGTHYMSSYGNQARPGLQEVNGKMQYFQNPQYNSKENFNFSRPEDAEYFAKYYKEVAPMMRNYQNGGETDQNPLLKSKTLLLEGNDENPQDLGPDANRSGFGINDKKIHISDNRKIRATTGKKINPNVALKTGDYDENVIDSLIKYSIKYNIDPNRVLAQGLAESTFGKKDSQNIGHLKHFYRNESPYPQMMEAILEGDRLAKTNKNKKTTREEIIQGYNGYGKLFPETEKDYHGGNSKAFYEVPFGKEGYLDMDKNPLYGIEIKDLMDNVISKDAQIQYKILKSKNPIKEEFYNPNNVKIPYRRKDFKYGGWLDTYEDGGLKSVTGPAPKLDAKTIAEGKRIASGYNNANKQNAQISQTRNWSQADQYHSNMVKARINNPASDLGILGANMASNITRFRNLTPEEIARTTDNVGETINLSSEMLKDGLINELVGYGATKAIPFLYKSAKAAGKYLTEETALKNAYKLNPYAFKLPGSPNVDFSKYLTQEEAVAARGERLISQKNKPGWNEQLTPELEQRLSTAVERHNPASDYAGEKLGANTMGRTATEVSKDANLKGVPLNEANKARIAAHETGHYYSNSPAEGEEWLSHFNLNKLESYKTRTYLRGKGRSANYANEIRERAAQLKDYIAQKNKIPLNQDFKITQVQLDDAIKNYVKDTGLDNTMSKMLGALKDKKGLLKTMNKYALGTVPAVIGAEALQNKQDNSQWLDKYK